MLKKTLISLAVGAALFSSCASALELGELTFQSQAGEPLLGSIVLSDVQGLTPGEVSVRLGSESEFRQAGFAPTRVLSQLRFAVVEDNGQLKVSVRSTQPLQADELKFVLAASWPSGQVVREYQVPLNNQVLVEKAQPEVVQNTSVPTATVTPRTTAPTSMPNSVFEAETKAAQALADKGQLGVKKGNTLWSIASANRPNNQLTIYQTMMAIQALNQDAFLANNINLLKEGSVLRLPTQEQIALFNQIASKGEFERQHQAWMALKAAGKTQQDIAAEQMNTQAASNTAPAPVENNEDKLQLASGQSVLPAEEAGSNPADQAKIGELESELSATQELLDKESREKAELSDKLSELNNQLATLEKLISLKDQQMAELQRQFMSAQQALQEQKNTVDQLLEADQLRREQEAAEQDSLTNKIFGNPIIISVAGAVLLLLGFLVGLIMRRTGKKKEKESGNGEFDLAPVATASAATAAVAAVAEPPATPAPETVTTTVSEPEEELIEEDPFAFDFDADESDAFNDFDEMEVPAAEPKAAEPEVAPVADELDDFDIPSTEFEEEDDFSALDAQMDELTEVDDILDDFAVEEDPQDDIPTMDEVASEDEFDVAAEVDELPSEDFSEEESFVSNLLNDMDVAEDDQDTIPDVDLEESIEESLSDGDIESDFGDLEVPDFGVEEANESAEVDDEEEDIDFFDASGDEVATKLDLARAYMDMGDEEGARVILEDVLNVGNESQIAEAQSMMERMFPGE